MVDFKQVAELARDKFRCHICEEENISNPLLCPKCTVGYCEKCLDVNELNIIKESF